MGQTAASASLGVTTPVDDVAAGGRSPAAAVSGPLWRDRKDRPVYAAEIWPNQSMSRPIYRLVLGVAGVGLAIPLAPLLGTLLFWGLFPFIALAFWGLWYAFRRNGRNLQISEQVWIWRDEMRVERREPSGRILRWQADPMKVRITIHADAHIESYLTLGGGGREIELGAFLAPEERLTLATEIEAGLTDALRR